MSSSDLVAAFAKRVFGLVRALKKSPMMWIPGIGTLVSPRDTPQDAICKFEGDYASGCDPISDGGGGREGAGVGCSWPLERGARTGGTRCFHF